MILSPKPRRRPHEQSALAALVDPDRTPAKSGSEPAHTPPVSPPIAPKPNARPHYPGSAPPWPARGAGSKQCRPAPLAGAPRLDAWLVSVSASAVQQEALGDSRSATPPSYRPSTCPASVDLSRGKGHGPPSFAAIIKHMAPEQQYRLLLEDGPTASGHTSATISPSGRVGTRHPSYRAALNKNGVKVDYLGDDTLPPLLKSFVDTQILQPRLSPRLSDEAVNGVRRVAARLGASSTEAESMHRLIDSDLFPCERPGICKGGGSQWNALALPNNPNIRARLSAPKPDACFGYDTTPESGNWTDGQINALDHPAALPYSQPSKSNAFPFLGFEMKLDAAGGSLFVAENQAAGSGSHSVNAVSWLFQGAGVCHDASSTHRVAFSVTLSPKIAAFYLHWHSEADGYHYMSHMESYLTLKPADIRACNSTVKNILDYGLGPRKAAIGAALDALGPLLECWPQPSSATGKRVRSTTPDVDVTVMRELGQERVGAKEALGMYGEWSGDEETQPTKKLKMAKNAKKAKPKTTDGKKKRASRMRPKAAKAEEGAVPSRTLRSGKTRPS